MPSPAHIAPPDSARSPNESGRTARVLTAAIGIGLAACGSSGDPPRSLPSAGAGGSIAGAAGSEGTAGNAGTAAGGSSNAGAGGAASDAGLPPAVGPCNVRIVASPPTSATHREQCTELSYSTNPPSGGDHYLVWAAFQNYDTPVPPGFLVHSLEHGAVVFWYNCPEGCADEVAEVEAFIAALPEDPLCDSFTSARRAVLVPYAELGSRWAASAWGFALTADCFDADEFGDFYAEHTGRAPEDFCNNGQTDVATRCP
jgi:hypothetical protein